VSWVSTQIQSTADGLGPLQASSELGEEEKTGSITGFRPYFSKIRAKKSEQKN
jgi:hypothetical protein